MCGGTLIVSHVANMLLMAAYPLQNPQAGEVQLCSALHTVRLAKIAMLADCTIKDTKRSQHKELINQFVCELQATGFV